MRKMNEDERRMKGGDRGGGEWEKEGFSYAIMYNFHQSRVK